MEYFILKLAAEFVTTFGVMAYGLVKIVPSMISKQVEQNRDYELKRSLQIDSYYRQNGSSELQDVMLEWTKMATDMEYLSSKSQKETSLLIQKTVGYGSNKSIRLAGFFFQYLYKQKKTDEDLKKGIVYVAMIVSSLKEDFTGVKTNPLDILKMKINDYAENAEFFETTMKNVEDSLRE